MHGFEITCWLEDRSGGELSVDDGALYQALHRMEERKHISAEWGITENNRRARYYKMTAAGRAYLRAESGKLDPIRGDDGRDPRAPQLSARGTAAEWNPCRRAIRLFRLAVRRRDIVHDDMDDEIRFHFEERVERFVSRGMTREDARAEALRRLGGDLDHTREQLHHSAALRERKWRCTSVGKNCCRTFATPPAA